MDCVYIYNYFLFLVRLANSVQSTATDTYVRIVGWRNRKLGMYMHTHMHAQFVYTVIYKYAYITYSTCIHIILYIRLHTKYIQMYTHAYICAAHIYFSLLNNRDRVLDC